MPDQPIFDAHCRLARGPDPRGRMLSTMDRWGIELAVVSGGGVIDLDTLARQVVHGGGSTGDADNDAVLAVCESSGGRLLPSYFANPHGDPADYLARAGEFVAVELSPAVHGVPLSDPRTAGVVAAAMTAGHSIYVVCLPRPGDTVADLVTLARGFPSARFVLGHLGTHLIDTYAIDLVSEVDNVLIETSGGFTVTLRVAVQRLGPGRLLFGTESPHQHPSVELAKYAALDLPAAAWRQIAWDNARRLYDAPVLDMINDGSGV
jgi:predicted TIM-barrel fold metal-dependent hydrolase